MIRPVFVLLLVFGGLFSTGTSAGGEPIVVVIKDFKFTPQEVTIRRGETVRWENHEKRQYHSVWFQASGDPEPDYFFPEEFYERSFGQTGNFAYRCGPHPKMTGTVHVID